MSSKIIIITGCSSGIGKALVNQFINRENNHVIGISRSEINIKSSSFHHIQADLSRLDNCKEIIIKINEVISALTDTEKIVLINNAGRLGEVKAGVNVNSDDLANTMFLNLTAPMLLQNALLKHAQQSLEVEILNISSGAAHNAYHSWGAYCASKAGLLMASSVTALEIENEQLQAKVWSLAPGVVDTNMQIGIRKTEKQDFPDIDRFIQLKENNELFSPEFVAEFIINAIGNSKFINGQAYDIRDFQ